MREEQAVHRPPDEAQFTPSDELAIWMFTVWSAAAKFWVA